MKQQGVFTMWVEWDDEVFVDRYDVQRDIEFAIDHMPGLAAI